MNALDERSRVRPIPLVIDTEKVTVGVALDAADPRCVAWHRLWRELYAEAVARVERRRQGVAA